VLTSIRITLHIKTELPTITKHIKMVESSLPNISYDIQFTIMMIISN